MHRRVVAACVWLSACLFPSLDGLSGSDGGGGDATLDAPADASLESGADADADASADAIADAVVGPFTCANVDARFCDDFDDEDAGPFAHWSSSYSGFGAYFARAASDASAPTASDFESFGWKDASSAPYAILEKDFVVAITSSAKLSFDMRVDQWPTSPSAYFNTGDLAFGASGGGTNLVVRQNASALQETIPTDAGTQYPSHTLTMNPVLGAWVHVDQIWTFASKTITVEVRFDGKTALPPTTLDPRHTYGVPTMRIGETYVDPTNDRASFLIDDVVFDFQ